MGVMLVTVSAVFLLHSANAQYCGGSAALLSAQTGVFTSPSYPNYYIGPQSCKWTLSSPMGTRLALSCSISGISCATDFLGASPTGDGYMADAKYACGSGTWRMNSTTQFMTVTFGAAAYSSNYGFRCEVTVFTPTSLTTMPPVTLIPTTPSPTTAPSTTCTCGVKGANRIVGGTQASVNEWPWQVGLWKIAGDYQFCGGTLIAPDWILTASHCVDGDAASEIKVQLGSHVKTQTTATGTVWRTVDKIIMHESYNSSTVNNDIALLHLVSRASYNSYVSPACLPYSQVGLNVNAKSATVTGWGTTSSGGVDSDVLLEVTMPMLNTTECRKYLPTQITDNMFCTYATGKDACQGDSGGPLNYQDPVTSRVSVLGIVSWGVGCARTGYPGVYTKLTNYLNWVQTKTGKYSLSSLFSTPPAWKQGQSRHRDHHGRWPLSVQGLKFN